jgi:hypothetical protein
MTAVTKPDRFDYSTPEAIEATQHALDLVLEIREVQTRKVLLYERTLGLAVIPVLLRRALIRLSRRRRERVPGAR